MTPTQYARMRRLKLGSQSEAARILGVHPRTISKRENGDLAITKEVEFALRWAAHRQRNGSIH